MCAPSLAILPCSHVYTCAYNTTSRKDTVLHLFQLHGDIESYSTPQEKRGLEKGEACMDLLFNGKIPCSNVFTRKNVLYTFIHTDKQTTKQTNKHEYKRQHKTTTQNSKDTTKARKKENKGKKKRTKQVRRVKGRHGPIERHSTGFCLLFSSLAEK